MGVKEFLDFYAHTVQSMAISLGSSIVHSAADTVKDLVDWCVGQIDTITRSIATWRYQFSLQIAEWLQDDVHLLIAIGLFIVASVGLVVGAVALVETGVWAKILTFIDDFQNTLGTAADVIHLQTLIAVHKIAVTLIPEYREQMSRISNAFAALAEQLGFGSSFLNACFLGIYTSMHATYQLLGIDTDTRAIVVMNELQTFSSKLDQRFYEYYRNPGKILTDIEQEIILPHMKQNDKPISDFWQKVNNTILVVDKIVETVDTVDNAIAGIYETLPKQIKATLNEKLGDFVSQYREWKDTYITPFVESTKETLDILNQYNIIHTEKLDDINIRLLLPASFLQEIEELPNEEKSAQQFILYDETTKALEGIFDSYERNRLLQLIEMREELAESGLSEVTIIEKLKTTLTITPRSYEPQQTRSGWFVGEY